jgi:DNA-binding FadR family transcriptional regulator
MDGEGKAHARIGTALLVLATWGSLAVSWGTQYQKTDNLAERIAEDRLALSAIRTELAAVRDKSELSARLEERLKALEGAMNRNNDLVNKLVEKRR